jgi:arabinose-5-phosphate isomerase
MTQPITNPIASGRATIAREIEGLQAVAEALDARFEALVALVAGLKGRLIVSGMGKSGHIGRKIAATLASTGTPSYFVHPAEASHGDLGMITPDDAVMCLSNSGETAELADLIHYCKRYHIPLIGMVRREGSMLVETADIAIVLPEVPEASPTGAPTTSTLMMLAYGDALAMALLEARGFTKDDFGKFHPGGKLGQGLLRAEALMHMAQEMPLVVHDLPMQDVLIAMTSKRFGCVGVLQDDGALAGIITDGDLRRHMGDYILEQTAAQVMTANPVTIAPKTLASEALSIMNEKQITCLFALNDAGAPQGIVHIHDLLRAGVQ